MNYTTFTALFPEFAVENGTEQVSTITINTVSNDTAYTVTIDTKDCAYTSDADATESEINAGLINAINTSVDNGVTFSVTATQGADTSTIILTGSGSVVGTSFTVTVTDSILEVAITTSPTLADTTGQARINAYIAMAAKQVNASSWGVLYEEGIAYLTAHMYSMANRGSNGGVGSITSASAGSVSVSYGGSTTSNKVGLDATHYGLTYLSLMGTLSLTPFVI